MNPENAIEVKDLKKKFKIYFDKGHMLKERLIFANRNKHEDRWVLNGISFDIKKGEAVGLIGRNGCGKSTTLKLLNRIIYPNGGSVAIAGKVSSLIELGAGFHEDMTGRENIYINASIFGLTKKEIDERLDDIIRFSELEEFIDNPVRTYSSGMYMRLAFSVAINVDADVLLIDEILAVGDVNFQEKCFQKLKDVKQSGTTIVIVSHSLSQIEKICDRCIWIENGLIREDGAPRAICKKYLESMEYDRLERAEQEYVMQKEAEERKKAEEEEAKKQLKFQKEEAKKKAEEEERKKAKEAERKARNATCRDICSQCGPDARREGTQEIRYTFLEMTNQKGEKTKQFKTGDNINLRMNYVAEKIGEKVDFILGVTRNDWVFCYGCSIAKDNGKYIEVEKNGSIRAELNNLNLLSGKYFLDIRIVKEDKTVCDNVFSIIEFTVNNEKQTEHGLVSMEHEWEMLQNG